MRAPKRPLRLTGETLEKFCVQQKLEDSKRYRKRSERAGSCIPAVHRSYIQTSAQTDESELRPSPATSNNRYTTAAACYSNLLWQQSPREHFMHLSWQISNSSASKNPPRLAHLSSLWPVCLDVTSVQTYKHHVMTSITGHHTKVSTNLRLTPKETLNFRKHGPKTKVCIKLSNKYLHF